MQHYAVEHYITGSQLMLEYNEQVSTCSCFAVSFFLDRLRLKDPDAGTRDLFSDNFL